MRLAALAVAVLPALQAGDTAAATIDFTTLRDGPGVVATQATYVDVVGSDVDAAVFSKGEALYMGSQSPNTICGYTELHGCASDLTILIVGVVENLTFEVFGWQEGDFAALTVSTFPGDPISTIFIGEDGVVDLSGLGPFSRLSFDDASTANGMVYGNFSFDVLGDGNVVVPLPASLPLLAAGLGGLALVRRRRGA